MSIEVIFHEVDPGDFHTLQAVDVVPRVGETICLDVAPNGVVHTVIAVHHRIGGASNGQEVTVLLRRGSET